MSSSILIKDLERGQVGVNITARVMKNTLNVSTVHPSGQKISASEFLVGDETGSVLLQAMDDQIDRIEVGKVYRFERCEVVDWQGYLRVKVGALSGVCAVDSGLSELTVAVDSNRSLILE